MTSPPLMNVNPLAPEILACPHAFNQQLREQAPVYHCPVTGIYFVSDYDNVVAIAKNEKRKTIFKRICLIPSRHRTRRRP